jgi:anti-anti-sigma regulatory factor
MLLRTHILDIAIDADADRVRLRADGVLCLLTTPMLRGALDGVLAVEEATTVEVDLTETTLLASMALQVLEETAVLLAAEDRRLVLTGAHGLVRQVIGLLGADHLLTTS